ncbi:ATP-dependent bile acid permease [Planoprotostelium fungivorum]|uniref:ATP-dependent bile acid permease n=1 Tax=Planoprotostelium fungivorum TaxID=1890364 RepID=A0A2P6NQQ7_9EUKA|nr:ATP-dependent bile acid permease [Planoprotostelium fungivorum]
MMLLNLEKTLQRHSPLYHFVDFQKVENVYNEHFQYRKPYSLSGHANMGRKDGKSTYHSLTGHQSNVNRADADDVRGGRPSHDREMLEEIQLEEDDKRFQHVDDLREVELDAGSQLSFSPEDRPCIETSTNWLSRVFFHWVQPMVSLGASRPLQDSDLSSLPPNMSVGHNEADFFRSLYNVTNADDIPTTPHRTMFMSMMIFTRYWLLQSALLKLVGSLSRFLSPLLLNFLLQVIADMLLPPTMMEDDAIGDGDVVDDASEDMRWKTLFRYGVILTLALCLNSVIRTIVEQYQYWQGLKDSLKLRNALMAVLYRKTLLLSSKGRQTSTSGQMMNLVTVDANTIMDWMWHASEGWCSIFVICLSVFLVASLVGWKVAGIVMGIMLLQVPLNMVLARLWLRLGADAIEKSDRRIGATNEMLASMRFVKLYNWEEAMAKKVTKARSEELHVIRKILYLKVFGNFMWSFMPTAVSIAIFVLFGLGGGEVTAPMAFSIIAIIQTLREPIGFLGGYITLTVSTWVSLKRVDRFLHLEEIDTVDQMVDEECAVRIQKGSFSWDLEGESTTLTDIDLNVKHKKLFTLVGPVGCGKSSLLSAVLGEIKRVSGSVKIWGRVAFTAQQPWIMNATVRDNILFGKPYDKRRYDQVVECCALVEDMKQFSSGDMSELGEKGINLSGGQKQRLALARAVYQDAEIYLFDEPLGAVDSSVAKFIFEECFVKFLHDKTRVLVTHQLQFLPRVDHVVVMEGGKIAHQGTFSELSSGGIDLSSIVAAHTGKLAGISEEAQENGGKSLEEIVDKTESVREKSEEKNGNGGKIIIAEERETGAVNTAVYKQCVPSHSKFKSPAHSIRYFLSTLSGAALLFSAAVFSVLSQTTKAMGDFSLTFWAKSNDEHAATPETTRYYIIIYVFLFAVHLITVVLRETLLLATLLKCARTIHDDMMNCMLRAKMSFFDATPSGRIINRFAKDQQVLDKQLYDTLADVGQCGAGVLTIFVVICAICPPLIPGILLLAFSYYFVQRYYIKAARELKRMESLSRSPMYHSFSECVQGASIIRGYGNERAFLYNRFIPSMEFNTKTYYWHFALNRWLAVRLDSVTVLVILFTGIYAIYSPSINSGLALSYSLGITGMLNWAVRQISQMEIDMNAAERTIAYTKITPEAPRETEMDEVNDNWPKACGIQLNDFWFRYSSYNDVEENSFTNTSDLEAERDKYILKGVTCDIKPKEKIGIVGRTGAGKSSLVTALFRLNEAAWGNISIDGVKIADLGLKKLRQAISIIPQDPVLFHESLRWNLDPFEEFSDQQIWDALDQANIKLNIMALPEKLSTKIVLQLIVVDGDNFSVGQKQLLCLARALLRHTKILVLDEASASLDLETDEFIQSTVRKAFADSTVLTIAHRMHTIIDSNRIMVLDAGRLVEMDTPARLMSQPKSKFATLIQHAIAATSPLQDNKVKTR